MKNLEEAIENVLAGLRDVDAPAGMEGRILGALEERASARPGSGWRVWPMMPGVPVGVRYVVCGFALAGLLAIGVPALRRIGQMKTDEVRRRIVSTAAPETAAKGAPFQTTRPDSQSREVARVRGVKHAISGAVAGATDSVAVSEMLAPSFPAPPMPLTEQEQLLLRIAHKGDPVEIAMLNPVVRDEREREEKAEVKRFFEPSIVEPSTTKQLVTEPPTTEQFDKGR